MAISISDDDVVLLNVGGEPFTCLRATLRFVKGSMLDKMFDLPWCEQLTKDGDGRVFLDWNPALFRPVLNHLRALHFRAGAAVHLPHELKGQDLVDFRDFVRYLLLEEAFFEVVCSDSFDPAYMYKNSQLLDDGRTAAPDSSRYQFACGKAVVKAATTARWSLRVTALNPAVEVQIHNIGVLENNYIELPQSHAPDTNRGALWRPSNQDIYLNGLSTKWPNPSWQDGDVAHLVLDTFTHELSLSLLRVNMTHKLPVQPTTHGWRLYISMTGGTITLF